MNILTVQQREPQLPQFSSLNVYFLSDYFVYNVPHEIKTSKALHSDCLTPYLLHLNGPLHILKKLL